MKKQILILAMLLMALVTNAQLKSYYDGRVSIMSTYNSLYTTLTVGNTSPAYAASVGIASAPNVMDSTNIGVLGTVDTNSTYTNDTNYGVLGIAGLKQYHGRSYGVSGMIGPLGQHFGGAGVYGTNSTYYFSVPTNIQGEYAGYFVGPVNVTNILTAPSIFTASDSRLSNNLVSLGDRDDSGKATLENVLNMNVVEYNMKSRLSEEMPKDVAPEKAEKVRNSFEFLKKEDKEMTSRRHFGIDAEELQKIYPDLVLEGQDGYLSVNYSEIVPLLIRSIQALKQELDEVKGMSSKARKSALSSGVDVFPANGNILYQNSPNPFNKQTVIRFNLAADAQNASVCLFDMAGKLLKKLPVSSGMESVSIGGYELGEGMFLYSLIVNGQEIDTKRMIISK